MVPMSNCEVCDLLAFYINCTYYWKAVGASCWGMFQGHPVPPDVTESQEASALDSVT